MKEKDEINTKINFGSQAFKKYFANTSWLFTEKVVRLVVGFFITIYIIRYLGPAEFGLLSYAISFVGLFAAIATLGLDNITVRELVKVPENQNEILGSAFFLRLFGALISLLLIVIITLIISESEYTTTLIFIIAFSTIFQSFNVIDFYFQSKVLSKFSVYVRLSAFTITTTLNLLLILFHYSLIYFAVVTSIESVSFAVGFNIVYKFNKQIILKWQFVKERAKQLLQDSWPLILSGLVISIYMRIDQVIIKNMLNNEEVGFYAVAVKLSEAWYFVPMAISTSLFPAVINAKKVSEILYQNRLQKLYDILAWIAIGISIPVTFFAKDIIKILYGPEYLPSAAVMTIYIWAGVAVFLGVASGQYLINENLTKIAFFRTFIGMIINVILNLALIPVMGITGSALATLISYSMATFSIGFYKKANSQLILMLRSIFLITLFKYVFDKWLYLSKKK